MMRSPRPEAAACAGSTSITLPVPGPMYTGSVTPGFSTAASTHGPLPKSASNSAVGRVGRKQLMLRRSLR